jgi:DNA-binding response OmpR family regulator
VTVQRSPRVLIVEDDSMIAYSNKLLLEASGFTVIGIVDEAVSGLLLAEASPPDIAIIDVHIHGAIDGISVARQLAETYGTQIVFVTGQPDAVLRQTADLHDVTLLAKPFQSEDLLAAITEGPSGERYRVA